MPAGEKQTAVSLVNAFVQFVLVNGVPVVKERLIS